MKNPATIRPIEFIDVELRELAESAARTDMSMDLVGTVREALKTLEEPFPSPAPQACEHFIPGRDGNPDVRLLIFDPSPGASNRPAVLFIHGGGMVVGTADDFPRIPQMITKALGCPVISVDYRLAPETIFPGALNDSLAALTWLHDPSNPLGIDTSKIAVAGQSAGGGHAAALVLAARDIPGMEIAFQLLIEPMLDDRTGSVRQVPEHLWHYGWSGESNRFGWGAMLGVPAGSEEVPQGSVPARVADLSGLPPTCIVIGGADLFVEENLDYAKRLMLTGVPTELYVAPGVFHGATVFMPTAEVSKCMNEAWLHALQRWLRT